MSKTLAKLLMTPSLRQAVMRKAPFGNCWYCGESANGRLHVEHQQPESRGGLTEYENLVPSCSSCNLLKGARTLSEFREFLTKRQPESVANAVAALEQFRWFRETPEQTEARRVLLAAYVAGLGDVVFFGERNG